MGDTRDKKGSECRACRMWMKKVSKCRKHPADTNIKPEHYYRACYEDNNKQRGLK